MGVVTLSQTSKDNLDGFIALIAGIILFKSLTYVTVIENVIQKYPLFVVILAFLLFFYRKKIADKFRNGGK